MTPPDDHVLLVVLEVGLGVAGHFIVEAVEVQTLEFRKLDNIPEGHEEILKQIGLSHWRLSRMRKHTSSGCPHAYAMLMSLMLGDISLSI